MGPNVELTGARRQGGPGRGGTMTTVARSGQARPAVARPVERHVRRRSAWPHAGRHVDAALKS